MKSDTGRQDRFWIMDSKLKIRGIPSNLENAIISKVARTGCSGNIAFLGEPGISENHFGKASLSVMKHESRGTTPGGPGVFKPRSIHLRALRGSSTPLLDVSLPGLRQF
jgi:hypothetical protein